MKKIISVLVIIVIAFSVTTVFAENNTSELCFEPCDLLFDTVSDSMMSLMSADDIENLILSSWNNMEEYIDVSEYKITEDEFSKLYRNILFANPEYFYVLSSYYYNNSGGFLSFIKPIYGITDTEEVKARLNEIDKVADEILFLISENMTDFDKVMTVHDYMVEHFCYDRDFYNNIEDVDNTKYYHQFTIEIMTEKMGVCQGYSLAFSYMMKKLGIDSRYVSSVAMDHAWNLVKLDGEWYHIDVTWDDTDNCAMVSHEYELLSTGCIQTLPNPHYGFDLGDIKADSVKFDDAPWHESTAGIAYCHGKAYWIDGDDLVDEDGNIIYENLAGADGAWNFVDNWIVKGIVFSGLAEYNGRLYFNTDKAIYTYNPHNNITQKLMDKTLVGGLYVDKNTLIYSKTKIVVEDDGAYVVIEDGGTIVLEHARFAEPYIKDGKIVARIYKECDDDIIVFSKIKDGLESHVITEQGYTAVRFTADEEADIYYWTSNLTPLRDKEEIIIN